MAENESSEKNLKRYFLCTVEFWEGERTKILRKQDRLVYASTQGKAQKAIEADFLKKKKKGIVLESIDVHPTIVGE